MKGVDNGLRLLVYGKRNTGKTSLVKNVVAKSWILPLNGQEEVPEHSS